MDTMNENDRPKLAYSIELTQEALKRILRYDAITGWFYRITTGEIAGTVKENGYIYITINGTSYPAHKLAWFYVYGVWVMVDHKDRCRHNNEFNNLRETTYQLNAANRMYIGNNSGAKGVYKRGDKFEVGIKIDQRRIYLGRFKTLEEAQYAYNAAAEKFFGEHAKRSGET